MKSKTTLNDTEHRLLGAEFLAGVQSFENSTTQVLLERLGNVTPENSVQSIADARREGRFSDQDLMRILGHHRFAVNNALLGIDEKLPIEDRREEWKTYGLIPTKNTLLGSMNDKSLSWSHNEAWAKKRFLQKDSEQPTAPHDWPKYYLCGQHEGKSKFFTVADIPYGISSDEFRRILAVEGDPAFEGQLYVLRAKLDQQLIDQIGEPLAPICYTVMGRGVWVPHPNFLRPPHAVVGFTSGGIGEVVMKTFEIKADNLEDLAEKGITVKMQLTSF